MFYVIKKGKRVFLVGAVTPTIKKMYIYILFILYKSNLPMSDNSLFVKNLNKVIKRNCTFLIFFWCWGVRTREPLL